MCPNCTINCHAHPKEMRNGRHFTHKTPESIGHTSQHIYPLLLEDKDIHHILIIAAFCFSTWMKWLCCPSRLISSNSCKQVFFPPLQVWENSHGSLIHCGAEEGSQKKTPTRSKEDESDAHTISAKEREGGREREKEGEKESGRERRTDWRSANCKSWNMWSVPFSCHHERTIQSLLNKTELNLNMLFIRSSGFFLREISCAIGNVSSSPLCASAVAKHPNLR